MKYKEIELYEKNGKYAVLVSGGYGAGWSTWGAPEFAYDKRIVQFWLDHKDDEHFMRTVHDSGYKLSDGEYHEASEAAKEAELFFKELGYDYVYMGGFPSIHVEWVSPEDIWRISEYDGAESLEKLGEAGFICFGKDE